MSKIERRKKAMSFVSHWRSKKIFQSRPVSPDSFLKNDEESPYRNYGIESVFTKDQIEKKKDDSVSESRPTANKSEALTTNSTILNIATHDGPEKSKSPYMTTRPQTGRRKKITWVDSCSFNQETETKKKSLKKNIDSQLNQARSHWSHRSTILIRKESPSRELQKQKTSLDFRLDTVLEKLTPTIWWEILEMKNRWTHSTIYATSNKENNKKELREKAEEKKERREMTKAISKLSKALKEKDFKIQEIVKDWKLHSRKESQVPTQND